MKYIRTKDGRIIDFDFIKSYAYYYDFDDNKNQLYIEWYAIKETFEIIKQADTIEELCDCFIGKVSNEEYIHLIGLWERKNYPAIKGVYGAIWTDKGLIYVAKMNDKGELELL